MLRVTFERDLELLNDRLLVLGSSVEENIIASVRSLRTGDADLSRQLVEGDKAVNEERIAIVMDALRLIALQQPVAGDMRKIASITEAAGELERINDYAKGIAKINLMIGPDAPNPPAELEEMALLTRDMLHKALQAARDGDAELAASIPSSDDAVDDLFNKVYRALIALVIDDSELTEQANHLQWAAHNLERAADRVTNICEWVIYSVTGTYAEMDSEVEMPPPQK